MCGWHWNLGSLTSWTPQSLSSPVMGWFYLFFEMLFVETCITLLLSFVRIQSAESNDTIAYFVSCNFLHFPFITLCYLHKMYRQVTQNSKYSFSSYILCVELYFSCKQNTHHINSWAGQVWVLLNRSALLYTSFIIGERTSSTRSIGGRVFLKNGLDVPEKRRNVYCGFVWSCLVGVAYWLS